MSVLGVLPSAIGAVKSVISIGQKSDEQKQQEFERDINNARSRNSLEDQDYLAFIQYKNLTSKGGLRTQYNFFRSIFKDKPVDIKQKSFLFLVSLPTTTNEQVSNQYQNSVAGAPAIGGSSTLPYFGPSGPSFANAQGGASTTAPPSNVAGGSGGLLIGAVVIVILLVLANR
jgi:hypothetical protein